MHYDIATLEDLVQDESVIEAEVVEIPTPMINKRWRMKKKYLENAEMTAVFKEIVDLKEENRRLNWSLKKAQSPRLGLQRPLFHFKPSGIKMN
jgi:hypothetical protein